MVAGTGRAGLVVADAVAAMRERVAPGVSTADLDAVAEKVIRGAGAVPSFKGYHGFPGTICASINDEVVHGKGALIGKMPGDEWQRFANLRLLYGHLWTHPGKKLLFMGGEFAQTTEWQHEQSLEWHLLEYAPHSDAAFALDRTNQRAATQLMVRGASVEEAAARYPTNNLETAIRAELARRLGRDAHFPTDPAEVYAALCRASAGGLADYAGISWERIDAERGVFWPCPSPDHPGTPRLFADGFPTPDGRARFAPVEHAGPATTAGARHAAAVDDRGADPALVGDVVEVEKLEGEPGTVVTRTFLGAVTRLSVATDAGEVTVDAVTRPGLPQPGEHTVVRLDAPGHGGSGGRGSVWVLGVPGLPGSSAGADAIRH